MASGPPKAILFDIGGVCVLSPMQAILDYEIANNLPRGWINVAISASKPDGAWHRMERGEMVVGKDFYEQFARDLGNEKLWLVYCERVAAKTGKPLKEISPAPKVDTEYLLNAIITISRNPDPNVYPALKKLKSSGKFVIGALSNTLALPDDHWAMQPPKKDGPTVFVPQDFFNPFVSSAEAGVRKPEMKAYQLVFELMKKQHAKVSGKDDLRPEDVVFLDDIGENLRQGKKMGFRTIKVFLGNTHGAVKELEEIVGMQLVEGAAKL